MEMYSEDQHQVEKDIYILNELIDIGAFSRVWVPWTSSGSWNSFSCLFVLLTEVYSLIVPTEWDWDAKNSLIKCSWRNLRTWHLERGWMSEKCSIKPYHVFKEGPRRTISSSNHWEVHEWGEDQCFCMSFSASYITGRLTKHPLQETQTPL